MSISAFHSPSTITLSHHETSISDCNSIDQRLLSPPETPRSEREVPFIPTDSNQTSLNMKRRHKKGDHRSKRLLSLQKRALSSDSVLDGSGAPDMGSTSITRSMTMPAMNHQSPYEGSDFLARTVGDGKRRPVHKTSRRWTLPSKASPTKGLTTLRPVTKYQTLVKKTNIESSPALITLRRATIKPSRKTSLTFFPPPTFSRTESSFMSYLLRSMTGRKEYTTENMDYLVNNVRRDSSDRSPIFAGSSQPAVSAMAEPLLTEILSDMSFANTDMDRKRRCSTRYVAGASVYEVIWDENDSPSSASEPSPPASVLFDAPKPNALSRDRRESAAMDKLETQLFKAIAQSRRGSYLSVDTDIASRRQSVQSLINMKFSRLINESALRSPPRSRASRRFQQSSICVPTDAAVQQRFGDEWRITSEENASLYSPLQAHASLNNMSNVSGGGRRVDDRERRRESTGRDRPRMGSMLGASSHVRRLSLMKHERSKQRTGVHAGRKTSSSFVLPNPPEGDETKPLLTSPDWVEENPWRRGHVLYNNT